MKRFLARNKYWILTPFVLFIVLFVLVLVLTENQSIAPFVYAIF
jgi:hypothetical protein